MSGLWGCFDEPPDWHKGRAFKFKVFEHVHVSCLLFGILSVSVLQTRFNRIELEVLSVVATQIESIMQVQIADSDRLACSQHHDQAKKQNAKTFLFPGEPYAIKLVPSSPHHCSACWTSWRCFV